MERFKFALNVMIEAMMQVSQEWERIDSNQFAEKYPFDTDFIEVIHRVIEWRDHIE
ncbi:hypothetical protein [Paenibacillus validus]|uniref:hypothetical protein n=1 Tax=Paenibacillus validus TaxID=44253 RepID=UPI003D2888E7